MKKYIHKSLRRLLESRMEHQEDIDALLDKINAQGMQNLTYKDRLSLDSMSQGQEMGLQREEIIDKWFHDHLSHLDAVEMQFSSWGKTVDGYGLLDENGDMRIILKRRPTFGPDGRRDYKTYDAEIYDDFWEKCQRELGIDDAEVKDSFIYYLESLLYYRVNKVELIFTNL